MARDAPGLQDLTRDQVRDPPRGVCEADASELADRLARWVTRNDPDDIVDDFALWEAEQPVSLQEWRARRENTPPK